MKIFNIISAGALLMTANFIATGVIGFAIIWIYKLTAKFALYSEKEWYISRGIEYDEAAYLEAVQEIDEY